jgi:hypothetical protein
MPVARAIWFLITFPLRAVYWLFWQIQRGSLAAVRALQRRIGQRNAMLLFAGLMGAFGLSLATGWIECGPRTRGCIDGWEVPQGLTFTAFAAYVAYFAVRHVPNVKQEGFTPEIGWWVYDPHDWSLSWRSVAFVGSLVAIALLVVWLVVSFR